MLSEVINRAARLEDVPAMADLFQASISDMYTKHDINEAPPPLHSVILGFKHNISTGIFRLAEVDGQIVAIASAVVRDNIWFLSSFWGLPDYQRKGIGMPLLKGVWKAGEAAGATIFCVHASPDITAMAAYMKMGMLPGHQIIYFRGQPTGLPVVPSGYEAVQLEKSAAMDLDKMVRGTGREPDHKLWLGAGGMTGRQVLRNGRVAGYYYIGRGGVVGPAGWITPQEAEGVMSLACRDAAAMSTKIGFFVPGINHLALRIGFEAGLKVVGVYHFLTTAAFGRMEQYIPSGPGLY